MLLPEYLARGRGPIRKLPARMVLPAIALSLLLHPPLEGQFGSSNANTSLMSRQALEGLMVNFNELASSSEGSNEIRERARQEIEVLRVRLESGDFNPGDQIELFVEGEEQLSETFVVADGRHIDVPVLGEIPLQGVLRSELEDYLSEFVGRFIRDPVVRAQSLTRIAILGAVGTPGFYVVPPGLVLSEAIMRAGGPRDNARVDAISLRRGDVELLDEPAVQTALAEGQTLDRLGMRAGDQIIVPERGQRIGGFSLVQMLITTVPAAILTLVTLFN
ncbi:MAG: hypothetical protein GEU90_10075 [Gemmatimonas sp.]|nr:hypothetical protein [Gemmatimonas sp.]